jgi:outer membrane autotransporter protein
LQLSEQEVKSLTLTLGGQVSYAISQTWGVLLPYASFDWVHEFDDDARNVTGKFINDPGLDLFALATDDPDRDYFTLGFGISAQLAQGRAAFLQYRTTLGLDDISSDSISAGIRLEF